MKYLLWLLVLAGCQVSSLSPEPSGLGVDISVDWSNDVIRHGLTYFGKTSHTQVAEVNVDSLNRGKKLYQIHCENCHGPKGDGDGRLASTLKLKPADLTKLSRKSSSNPMLIMVVQRGRKSMPSWENILTNRQSVDVTNYIMTLGK